MTTDRDQTAPWWEGTIYEVLPTIANPRTHDEWLTAAFTPNNGIRITIVNRADPDEDDETLCSFDFNADQAEMIGQALVRWAQRRRANRDMVRRGVKGTIHD
jgi:hypothetical protein